MAAPLPPQMIDLLLLGAPDRRRQLQDLPILGDVWSRLAENPEEPQDLLIIPCRGHSASDVAELIEEAGERHNRDGDRSVASLDGIVVATLTLDDIIDHILPFTIWWDNLEKEWKSKEPSPELSLWIAFELSNLLPRKKREELDAQWAKTAKSAAESSAQQAARLGVLLGVFKAAGTEIKASATSPSTDTGAPGTDLARQFQSEIERLGPERIIRLGEAALRTILKQYPTGPRSKQKNLRGAIFQVTMNREAELALAESVSAIKADAARSLFSISCSKLAWAVLDSGIDHRHPAFLDRSETGRPSKSKLPAHRIREAFDFTRIRAILGVRNDEDVPKLAADLARTSGIDAQVALKCLPKIVADRKAKAPIDWHNIENLIRLDVTSANGPSPTHPHGTHVAGIIAADWPEKNLRGVCPDIRLYDFRVLGSDLGDSEFAVSAALQFIRYYNEQGGYQRIHGVNMSLAIRHNVRNYACGQTPVCIQAEALVSNGVVVVAAAGNRGYQQYQLADQTTFEGYASSSITDPGNAEGVITVGATHRSWPHTYGVSFFSSRGPTGDGRLKPDLLAPGEKITSSVPGGRTDVMDGTSMAAPHVSGAAALLIARHEELKGRPTRIKEILCSTATDLKRERHFQGHGMVDVLRAIQSI